MKRISILLVVLIIIGMIGCTQVVAQENDLEELVGLKIKVWQDISANWPTSYPRIEGLLLEIKGNWVILRCSGNKYVWCSISEISRIEILNMEYRRDG